MTARCRSRPPRVIDTSWGGVSSRLRDASSISAASGFSFGDPNTVDAS